ncbi:hypothetical protein [Bdellovibrio sp.]|uniref:hypothetical protein n=1 Tax=Bdellovibrio sp. TaxID=28201 RepID=UPI0039E4C527
METRALKYLCTLAIGFILTGCQMDASIQQATVVLPSSPHSQKAQLNEFVSGSGQLQVTSGNYRVDSSFGSYTSKIEETTQGGYKVFISAQGNIISN